jgi:hypothetical protein
VVFHGQRVLLQLVGAPMVEHAGTHIDTPGHMIQEHFEAVLVPTSSTSVFLTVAPLSLRLILILSQEMHKDQVQSFRHTYPGLIFGDGVFRSRVDVNIQSFICLIPASCMLYLITVHAASNLPYWLIPAYWTQDLHYWLMFRGTQI